MNAPHHPYTRPATAAVPARWQLPEPANWSARQLFDAELGLLHVADLLSVTVPGASPDLLNARNRLLSVRSPHQRNGIRRRQALLNFHCRVPGWSYLSVFILAAQLLGLPVTGYSSGYPLYRRS
ncbi:hypothetical protein [Nibrella saemangeumensis]|uniref:hypothetical protein n=1 Tax=Nibrella saemangeumensis TaxID=1084526 RepID=UPI0031E56269